MNKDKVEINKIKTQLEMLDELYKLLKERLYEYLRKDELEDLLHSTKKLLHLSNLIKELKCKFDNLKDKMDDLLLMEQLKKVAKIDDEEEKDDWVYLFTQDGAKKVK